MVKKKGYKKGGVTKKMVGGAMKKKPVAMKKGGAPETSLRPKARPLSKKEKERKEIDADMKRLRQKSAMRAGLDDYGRGKAASQGRLKNKSAEKSESFLFTLPEEKKKGGAVKKKMGGGMMKTKGYAKGGKQTGLRPRARPASTRNSTILETKDRAVSRAFKKQKNEEPILRPTRDGKAMTTKPLLRPRADGTGLTTDPKWRC
jgi:hypothetical protein